MNAAEAAIRFGIFLQCNQPMPDNALPLYSLSLLTVKFDE